jgi:hypothetical protein
MASDTKKTKADPAPKNDAAAKVKTTAAEDAPKADAATKAKSTAAEDTPKDTPKTEGGETAAAAPANYSRGEGQKPVTAAYKENWNAIFAKKSTKKRTKKKKR